MEKLEFNEEEQERDEKEILFDGKVRDYDVEELGIKMFARKVKTCISEEEIRNALISNGFNGIYMFPNDIFRKLNNNECVNGYYDNTKQRIVINRDYYKDNKDVAVHELVHAYLSCKSRSFLQLNEITFSYGHGLEEGCCAIIQKVNSINNIDDCMVAGYHYQAHLIKQLNALYKNSSNKKYPNLLHHLLKEPKDFLPAIARIYEDILIKLNIDIDVLDIGLKSAFSIVSITDCMVGDKEYDFKQMYTISSCMNTVYLYLLNKQIRNGEKINNLFPNFEQAKKTKEERLQELIFGDEFSYFRNKSNIILGLLNMQQEELEFYGEYKSPDYKCLKRK